MKRLFILYLFATNILLIFSQDFKPENLGTSVNTIYSEISPYISPDGKSLFFIRKNYPENTRIKDVPDCSDIWYSKKLADSSWSTAMHLNPPFNRRKYNSLFAITPDGNSALVKGAFDDDEYIQQGFSFTHKTAKGWSSFQKINVQDFEKLCLGSSYGANLSNDGKVLIIYMSEKENSDINDLYVSFRENENSWTRPTKIESLSTKYKETTPFIASDGITLYFSSDRPGGFGSNDIYMTRRLDDTWQKWSDPQNLGASINSTDWDAYYSTDANGEYAYMVTYANSIGKEDIVRIRLTEDQKPQPVVLIYGQVFNSKTKEPISATILYELLPEGKNVGRAQSSPEKGEYKIVLPYGKLYGFSAREENYISVSDNIDLTTIAVYQEIKRDLFLTPIEIGQTIRLNNIFFDFGKATLRPESFPELDRVVLFMNENPNIEIEISGHTDNVGSDVANLKLSANRANSVRDYIVSKGILDNRIIAKGYGKTKPIAKNDTEKGKQQNRRVEFTILKN